MEISVRSSTNCNEKPINAYLLIFFFHLFSYDVLILRSVPDSSILAILTGSSVPAPFNSTGNRVYVEFVSDGANAQNGFKFEYEACKYQNIITKK